MSNQRMMYAGIDAGGTQTRLVYCFADDVTPRYANGPGVNVKRDGIKKTVDTCAHILLMACGQALADHQLVLCAGIAGAGRPQDQEQITRQLTKILQEEASQLPHRVSICTDAEIAYYAAHKNNSGCLIIIGTGSIIFAKTREGAFVRAGGWGYLAGDEAGGFRLAQAGLEAIANAFDGGPATLIQEKLQETFSVRSADAFIDFIYSKDAAIQQVAPLVVESAEAGDAVAVRIVEEQVTALAQRISWLLKRHPDIDLHISLTGGLSNNDYYKKRVTSAILAVFPVAQFLAPRWAAHEAALKVALSGEDL